MALLKKAIKEEKTYFASPIGILEIVGNINGIIAIHFANNIPNNSEQPPIPECLTECVKQLDEYFKRERKSFTVKLNLQGSPFQKIVWDVLQKIPYGETKSYMQVAEIVRNKDNVRAVGSASSKNRVSIVVPCHRVIGTGGKLTGYAGGLKRKEWLINFERGIIQGSLFTS